MKLLLIDNTRDRDSWGSDELRSTLTLPEGKACGIELHTRRAPHEDLPSQQALLKFDRIVLSGSATSVVEDAPWIESLLETIRFLIDRKIPLLGICYGHQMLARAIGGRTVVRRSQSPEIGWTKISQRSSSQSPLLQGLPEEFFSFSMHYDEVCSLPENTQLLASSELCPIQALQVVSAPAYGLQFHPERGLPGAAQTFASAKKRNPRPPLLHPDRQDLHDPEVAAKLIQNFYSLDAGRA